MKDNSKKITKGDTYISLSNNSKYIEEAINNGANKVIVESGLYSVDTLVVNNTRNYLINYLDNKYKDKFNKIKIIGITGTNGKTTSAYILWQILNRLGYKTGYIGTIGFFMEGKVYDLKNTTPDLIDIYEMINTCVDHDYQYIIMEVSSQSLSYNRIGNLLFDYAIFTNLTKDHLDYHKDMNNYALAKQKLFKQVKGKCLINYDDINKNYFILDNNKNYYYGFNGGDYQITDYTIDRNGSSFSIDNIKYKTNLIGHYNLYNILVVYSVLKLEQKDFLSNIWENVDYPKGRMEMINYKTNKIVVDYAHTPDAVLNIISTIKKLGFEHIITIIGCGGNRDKSKRSEMGIISTSLSDYVIFTSDNPRNEKPNEIIKDMIQKLDKNNYKIELNRKKAIVKGIQMLKNNDILLVLGKGHEDYQVIGNEKIPFSDIEIIKQNI